MADTFIQQTRASVATAPKIARLTFKDLHQALIAGWHDFLLAPSHAAFLALLYPLAGVVLAFWTSGNGAWQLIYPLVAGFALLGPLTALPLYETSRRHALGEPPSLGSALKVIRSPSLVSITVVGVVLLMLFTAWITVAQALYVHHFGNVSPASFSAFLARLFETPEGWKLIVYGNLAGILFAIAVLVTGFMPFPLLLDRDIGAVAAIHTSIRVALLNPLVTLTWGVIVLVALVLGALTLLVGLSLVLPVLGHATWHLYRKAVPFNSVAG